ncbi:MAG TPA: ribonuclease HI family protein [Chloroflexi bacterium]|nr:ribonuclease HI family protein [Chloroflexota bacterium]
MAKQWGSRRGDNNGRRLILYTDGAIRPNATGLAAVVRDRKGRVVTWRSKRLPQAMTCNEAEYEAVLLGLEMVRALRPLRVEVRTDSQVVVNQMLGLFAVRSAHLRRLHAQAREAVAALGAVEFVHVPRLRNRLADALANEAADEWRMEIGD